MRVPISSIDIGQVIYHGNYFELYNQARDDFFRKNGFPYINLMNRKRHLAVAEVNCKFIKPLQYDQEIEITTGIGWVRSRSINMLQKIFRIEKDGSKILCNEASFNMVCINFEAKVTTLPNDFKEFTNKFRNDSAQSEK